MIAIGINATASDDRTTKKQMSGMKEFDVTKDEIVNVIRVGSAHFSKCPPFKKGMKVLYEIREKYFFTLTLFCRMLQYILHQKLQSAENRSI